MPNRILHSENLAALRTLHSASVQLIYVDPPFNTGTTQKRTRMKTVRDAAGDRTGFGGQRYRTEKVTGGDASYTDTFDDYISFLRPRMVEARRVLTATGSLFLHIDPREVHYAKVMLDEVFALDGGAGRECFRTRSSGPTTTARARRSAGRPSMTTSCGTPRTRSATHLI